jgi:hypothetical protein
VGKIRAHALAQAAATGVGNKQQIREGMCDSAMPVIGALKALAEETMDAELLGKVNFTRSVLLRIRDTACSDRCRLIHTIANERDEELVPFGLSNIEIETLDSNILSYEMVMNNPSQKRVALKLSTTQLKNEFAAVDRLLKKKLDNLMLPLKGPQPGFYIAYQASRVIVDYNGGNGETPETPPPPTPPTP